MVNIYDALANIRLDSSANRAKGHLNYEMAFNCQNKLKNLKTISIKTFNYFA